MYFSQGKKKKFKIGLAFGSGGARGLAHIGVIKVLEENNIPISFIAGSSIGALVGGLYAALVDIKKIEGLAKSNSWRQILSLVWDPAVGSGLISGKKIEIFIRKQIGNIKFSDLRIPFTAMATNFETGEPIVLKSGDVASAIRASISVPIIFKPVEFNGKILVDGGLSEPVPVNAVKAMGANFIIAVNLDNCYKDKNKKLRIFEAASNSLAILRHHLAKEKVKEADIVIEPRIFSSALIGWRDFMESKKIIAEGEKVMRMNISKIKRMVGL